MKLLTPPQKAIVDVMQHDVTMRRNRRYGWFEYLSYRGGYISTNTAKSLVSKGVLVASKEDEHYTYYKLTPEYLNA